MSQEVGVNHCLRVWLLLAVGWALGLACGPALAGPVEDAATAYEQGDYATARQLWLALAGQGDVRAMNNLGVLCDRGQGAPENPAEAAQWFRRAAEGGHGPGMSNYGRMLEQGRGLPRDAGQAAQWFRQAADKNVADAQYNLAVLFERGEGVPQSEKDAAAWYSRAAANQQVNAQARLGQIYRDGKGVGKNATRATLLLYGAAMEGHADAMHDLEELGKQEHKGKAAKASLFGLELGSTTRAAMRAALSKSKVPVVREDAQYICDVYDVRKAIPGATEMAACYGPSPGEDKAGSAAVPGSPDSAGKASASAAHPENQPLGFVKIDYSAPDKKQAGRIRAMVEGRFGKPSAGERDDGALWNLGSVIVATQFVSDSKQVGLMYMVPRVYHLTRQAPGREDRR